MKNKSSDEQIKQIVKAVAANFRSFGGGKTNEFNPIALALKDEPPQFAAGVDIEGVVRFVVDAVKVAEKEVSKRKPK